MRPLAWEVDELYLAFACCTVLAGRRANHVVFGNRTPFSFFRGTMTLHPNCRRGLHNTCGTHEHHVTVHKRHFRGRPRQISLCLYSLVHTVFSYKLSDASPESYLPSSLFLFNRYCFTSLITTREGCLLTAFLSLPLSFYLQQSQMTVYKTREG